MSSKDVLSISAGDLAALSFRSLDELRRAVSYLEGRVLAEGERVVVTIEALVTRTPGGSLIFGTVSGTAQHGV